MSLCPKIFPLHMSHAVLNSDAIKGLRSASLSIPLSCSHLASVPTVCRVPEFDQPSTKRTRSMCYLIFRVFYKKNPAGLIILRVLQSNLKLMTAFYMATTATSNLFYSAKTSTRAQTAPLFLLRPRPRSRPHIHPYYYRSFCNVGKRARMSRSVTHRRRLRLRRVRGLRVRSSARTHVQQGNNRRAASEGGAARAAS